MSERNLPPGRFHGMTTRERTFPLGRLAEKRHQPGERLGMHRHASAYMTFVLAGGYEENGSDGRRDCVPGTLVIHPPEDAHADHFGARASRLLVFEAALTALPPAIQAAFERRQVLAGAWSAEFGRRLRASLVPCGGECGSPRGGPHGCSSGPPRRAAESPPGPRQCAWPEPPRSPPHSTSLAGPDEADERVLDLLLELTAEVLPRPLAESECHPSWLAEAQRLLAARFHEPIGLTRLAAELDVHPSHLAREHRRWTGRTVGQRIGELRLAHALDRLRGDVGLAELAAECGFADQSHFNRAFRRATGMTPGAVRGRERKARRSGG